MDSVKIVRNGVEAEILDRYLSEFLKDGWAKADESTADDSIESKIAASESKDEIELLIKSKFSVDLDKRGSIETVKEKALAIIRDSKTE